MTKVAIYCRLSQEDRNKRNSQDDSDSIQNQKKMLLSYAIQNDWEVYRVYADDDYSGSDRNRPEFTKLIEDAQEKKFDVILCKSQSRFTREMELVEKYINYLLPLWGIRFIGLVDNADTDNTGNKKSRQIMGLTNEWYIEGLSQDIRKVLRSKQEEGLHIGSTAAYGYIKDPKQRGHIIIDPEAAAIVRQIFEWSAEGYGIQTIARKLNQMGVPNPSTYKEQKGIPYKRPSTQLGSYWKYYSVQRMLHNEVYIGNMVQGRQRNASYKSDKKIYVPKDEWIVVQGTHEPIIGKELWDIVQIGVTKRSRGETAPGEVNPFARKLFCAECGHTLRSWKNKERRYFRCPTKLYFLGECKGCMISYIKLEKAVLTELNEIIEKYLDKNTLEKNLTLQQDYNDKILQMKQRLNELKNDTKKKEQRISDLYDDKLNGVITKDEFRVFAERLRKENDAARQEYDTVEKKLQQLKETAEALDVEKREQLLRKYINVEKLDRAMVDSIIEYIVISRRNKETDKQEIEIHWKF